MKTKTSKIISIQSKKQNWIWVSVVLFVIVLSVIGMKVYFAAKNESQVQNLETLNSPENVFKETQSKLLILSTHLNTGIKSAQYLEEYDKSKNLIFKEPKK